MALAPRLERLLHVGAKRLVLNEPPRFVHDAELQRVRRAVGDAAADTVQDVEEQGLEQRGIGAHGLEVEHLEWLDVERVVGVVEEVGVASAVDPLRQPASERAWQQVRQGEEPPLRRVEDVEVLDRFVQLAVFGVAQTVAVGPFQQHADERVEKVQVLRRRVERERVDAHVLVTQAQRQVAAVEERRELPVAVPEIEDDRQRVVLLGVHHQEVQQEALPAARRAEHERVSDIVDMQVEVVRRLVLGLQDRQGLRVQVRTARLAGVQGEEEAQVGIVRFEQRQTTEVVRTVAGDDGEPGVQEVVRLVDERAVMAGQHLDGLGGRPLEGARVLAEEDQRERAVAEEVPVHLELGQGVAELPDGGARALVHEHLVGPSLGRDVVHHRHALVEEVAPAELEGPPHPVVRNAAPLQAGDELTGQRVQVLEHLRERGARRLLHRQHLHPRRVELQVVAMAVEPAVGDEVVEVRVVLERCARNQARRVVHEVSEELKGVGLVQARWPHAVRELHLEGACLLVQMGDGTVDVGFDESERRTR